jgi:precorrin-6B methylase 2
MSTAAAIWHDLECGAYEADLALWRQLASRQGGAVLDVGAGTGRVAIDLAAHGHRVTALDIESELLVELERRAEEIGGGSGASGLPLITVAADARDFELDEGFGLIVVPMQTIQLLGGPRGRARFLRRAAVHLNPGGHLAVAITELFETYDSSTEGPSCLPLAEVRSLPDGVYRSQPTAVRQDGQAIILERRREILSARGRRVEGHRIQLDRLTAAELESEGQAAGLRSLARVTIPPTDDHVGSVVVILGG